MANVKVKEGLRESKGVFAWQHLKKIRLLTITGAGVK